MRLPTASAATPAAPGQESEAGILTVTEAAAAKVRHFATTQDEYRGQAFRVYVEGGGCSGFQYGFRFDAPRQGDVRLPLGDVDVIVDPQSAQYLRGSVLDYQESLAGAMFVIRNPNATGACGCGLSFSI